MTAPRRATAPIAACVHHWRIDTPNGAESAGVCRKCGAQRAFRNCAPQDAPEHTGSRAISLAGSYPKRRAK